MKSPLVIALGLLVCASPILAAFEGSQPSAAEPSTTVKLEYRIHQTPSDPQSPVVFTIVLGLERQSTAGSQVAWHAGMIQFRKKGTGGAADTVWEAYDVEADTTDGLWHVTHSNPSTPVASEFTLPPRYFGIAEPLVAADGDLDFDFRGRAYLPPAGGAPYEVTGGMTYDFDTAVGPDIPPGTDEPVDVPPIGEPSGTG